MYKHLTIMLPEKTISNTTWRVERNMGDKNENELVLFETEDNAVKLEVPFDSETVWLSANQMAVLFDRDEKTIRKHVNNVFF